MLMEEHIPQAIVERFAEFGKTELTATLVRTIAVTWVKVAPRINQYKARTRTAAD